MNKNYNANKPLLHDISVGNVSFFSDFGIFVQEEQNYDVKFVNNSGGIEVYKLLVKEYPIENSLFILNIRNVYHWLHSRFAHHYVRNMLNRIKAVAKIDTNLESLTHWKTLWYRHICGVIRYVEANQINHHLLIFDVESDDIQKLVDFGQKHGIELDADKWVEKNHRDKKKLEQSGIESMVQHYCWTPRIEWKR